MDEDDALIMMAEIVGRVHRNSSEMGIKKAKKGSGEENPKEKLEKFKQNMSPLAESTLCLLLRAGDSNQSAIARYMHVSAQAISELMKKLEKRELIIRVPGDHNNEIIIRLTELGEDTAKEYKKKREEVAVNLFQNLTEEEQAIFILLLRKVKGENNYNFHHA